MIGMILSVAILIIGVASFAIFIMVLVKLVKEKGILHGIVGFFCSIYPFIWGWMNHKRLAITKLMAIWTAFTVLSAVMPVIGVFLGVGMMATDIGKQMEQAQSMPKKNPLAARQAMKKPMIQKTQVSGIDIVSYGIYDVGYGNIEKEPDGSGKVNISDYRLLRETDRIPADIGTFFGFEYTVRGKPEGRPVAIEVQNEYPGLKEHGKSELIFVSETKDEANIDKPRLMGFRFDQTWHLEPGKWIFRLSHGGKRLATKEFIVEASGAPPATAAGSLEPAAMPDAMTPELIPEAPEPENKETPAG